jgi:hypothetical protein
MSFEDRHISPGQIILARELKKQNAENTRETLIQMIKSLLTQYPNLGRVMDLETIRTQIFPLIIKAQNLLEARDRLKYLDENGSSVENQLHAEIFAQKQRIERQEKYQSSAIPSARLSSNQRQRIDERLDKLRKFRQKILKLAHPDNTSSKLDDIQKITVRDYFESVWDLARGGNNDSLEKLEALNKNLNSKTSGQPEEELLAWCKISEGLVLDTEVILREIISLEILLDYLNSNLDSTNTLDDIIIKLEHESEALLTEIETLKLQLISNNTFNLGIESEESNHGSSGQITLSDYSIEILYTPESAEQLCDYINTGLSYLNFADISTWGKDKQNTQSYSSNRRFFIKSWIRQDASGAYMFSIRNISKSEANSNVSLDDDITIEGIFMTKDGKLKLKVKLDW